MSESELDITTTTEHIPQPTNKERTRRLFTELMIATFFQGSPQQARELLDKQLALDRPERS